MKKLGWFLAFLGILTLVGCGHLQAKVRTNRDLTKEEVVYYQEQEDGFRLIILYPLASYGKALVKDDENVLMGNLYGFLNLPVPIVGCGYFQLRGAAFDENGKRVLYFGLTNLSPLFSRIKVKAREDANEPWVNILSYTTFLHFFGFGNLGDQNIVKLFANFGASQKDINEAIPSLGIGDK